MTTRTAMLRISTTEPDDQDFRVAISEMTERVERLDVSPTVDAWLSVSTDADGEPEHPERDALLGLADRWQSASKAVPAGSDDAVPAAAMSICADELVRLVATLSL